MNKNHYFKFIKNFLKKTKGQKRLFLFCGLINILITNIFLQILLTSNFVSTSIATFLSQLINTFCGYYIYSKVVFRNKNLLSKKEITKYSFLMIILWLTNFYSIKFLELIGLIRNIAALILIPFLATISFFVQRFFIFKNSRIN